MALTLIGCRGTAAVPDTPAATQPSEREQPKIHRVAEEGAASVNTYLIEGERGLVAIDAQRSISAAERVCDAAASLGKPIVAVLLTHAHPDHYSGLGVLTQAFPAVPVYASATAKAIIEEDRYGYNAATRRALPDDSFAEPTIPTHIFRDSEVLVFDDIQLRARDAGNGEGEAMTVFVSADQDRVFTGDLLANGMTPFLLEARPSEWVAQLQWLLSIAPDATAFPGHGAPGPLSDLVEAQLGYLEAFVGAVRARIADGEWSSSDREAVVSAIEQLYPGYVPVAEIPTLLTLNADAVAARFLKGTDE